MTEVRIAETGDADEVGGVLAMGFLADPVMSWVFSEPGRAAKLAAFFGFLAREAYIPLGATHVLPGACAVWTPPGTPEWSEEMSLRFARAVDGICSWEDLGRLGILGSAVEEHHPDGPHWYLSSVAVAPAAQGRGVGSALLRASLKVVDDDLLPAYLESTNPRNVALYERHGFAVTGQIELPGGPGLTAMLRPPAEA